MRCIDRRVGTMFKNEISVLLPALDEELTLGRVIDGIPVEQIKKKGYDIDIMVVDGHSTDNTQKIALAKGARLILQEGRGKGLGLKTAFKASKGKYLFMMDSDDTYPGYHILEMLDLLESGKYDVVLGSRLNGNIMPGAMTGVNYLGNKILTQTANILFPNGHKVSDLCTGMWGFKGDVVRKLQLEARHFDVEAEMYAKCVKMGCNIGEIPIEYRKRIAPSKLSSVKHGVTIATRLLKEKI
ncbi:MAG: glycosyltransferase [Methanomassiliicoccales archaeon]|nr:MAG: glycosyltransferase [Methanomassiliicoccales archaeon]